MRRLLALHLLGTGGYILTGLILLGIDRLYRINGVLFYVAVAIAASIKIHLLVYLVIPIILFRLDWLRTATVIGIVGAYYAFQRICMPTLFASYVECLRLSLRSNPGMGVLVIAQSVFDGSAFLRFVYLILWCLSVVVVVAVSRLASAAMNERERSCYLLPLVTVASILILPRVKEYDAYIAILPAFQLSVWLLRETEWTIPFGNVCLTLLLLPWISMLVYSSKLKVVVLENGEYWTLALIWAAVSYSAIRKTKFNRKRAPTVASLV